MVLLFQELSFCLSGWQINCMGWSYHQQGRKTPMPVLNDSLSVVVGSKKMPNHSFSFVKQFILKCQLLHDYSTNMTSANLLIILQIELDGSDIFVIALFPSMSFLKCFHMYVYYHTNENRRNFNFLLFDHFTEHFMDFISRMGLLNLK